uniref:Protein kinase domain-containing protein n=2 Tax=Panagrellus redivivus TaxID=6233 RepID=A0A7E4UU53_PANRE
MIAPGAMSSNVLIESDALPTSTTTAPTVSLPVPVPAVPRSNLKRRYVQRAPIPSRPRRCNNISLDLSQVPDNASSSTAPSSPGDSVGSPDSQHFASTSDDDSQGLDGAPKKRLRGSSPSVCSTDGVGLEIPDGLISTLPSSSKSSDFKEKKDEKRGKYLDINTEYEFFNELVVDRGSPDFATFTFLRLTPDDHKRFLSIAERVEYARNYYEPSEYKRLKAKIIPEDTRIVYTDKLQPVLLTPFNGESLDTFVKKRDRDLPESEVQPIIKQVLEVLDFCHSVNMFLLDFKLSKFVFSDKDASQLRICTPMCLKMSNSLDDDRYKDRACSILYMAPEMLYKKHLPYCGVSADLWALGVMTFTLLSKKRFPFTGDLPQNVIECIRQRRFCAAMSENVSYLAKQFVYGLLSLKPADRATARRQLLTPWMSLPLDVIMEKTSPYLPRSDTCLERIARQVRIGFQNAVRDAYARNAAAIPTSRSLGVQTA